MCESYFIHFDAGADYAVVSQRRVDGDGGPCGLHQVLAEQHEQRQDVPGDHFSCKSLTFDLPQAHKEAIRRVSFCPTDAKFASCSDDGTVSSFAME